MASYQLHNEKVFVEIDEHASEIHHFQDLASGIEYMWQGDPQYWKGRNPTLFPMVGSTWDKKLHIDGNEYVTGNHGFTRNCDFTCIEHTDTKIINELTDNTETRKQYPFAFTMHIAYTLDDRTLSIHYEITNENDCTMPFNFGLHPAFNCPLTSSKKFTDAHIEFDHPEVIPSLGTNAETSSLSLDRDALAQTIIIDHPKSTSAVLTDGEHQVKVSYHNYEWLAFWSPNAPFVCIEPWHSHTDFEKTEVPFEKREGTILLAPHALWTTDYAICVE